MRKISPRFIALTGACGGSGISTAAICMGRTLSRIYEKKTLLISFEALSSKICSKPGISKVDLFKLGFGEDGGCVQEIEQYLYEDAYGLKYFTIDSSISPLNLQPDLLEFALEQMSLSYEAVVLDLPANCSFNYMALAYCEDIVEVYGINDSGHRFCNEQMDCFIKMFPNTGLHKLFMVFDENKTSEDVDIHGELGARVREIVDRIQI